MSISLIAPQSSRFRLIAVFSTLLLATSMFSLSMPTANAATSGIVVANGVSTTDLNAVGSTALKLAQSLMGPGVTNISGATFTGDKSQAGSISIADPQVVSFNTGVILSSGNIADIVGPNKSDGITGDFNNPGDTDLDALIANTQTVHPATYDAASLEFNFTPNTDTVYFTYVFGSDEYLEWVNLYNDVFGLYVNGSNCALTPSNAQTPGVPVTIDTINSNVNSSLFRDNAYALTAFPDPANPMPVLNIESDGLSVEMICKAHVNVGISNHIKFVIADTSDHILDSVVMIKSGSLSTTQPESCNNKVDDDGDQLVDDNDPFCTSTTTSIAVSGSPSGVTTPVVVATDPTLSPQPSPIPAQPSSLTISSPAFTGTAGNPILLDATGYNESWTAKGSTVAVSWQIWHKGDLTKTNVCQILPGVVTKHDVNTNVIEKAVAICPVAGEYTASVRGLDSWSADPTSGGEFDYDLDFFVHNAPPVVSITDFQSDPLTMSVTVSGSATDSGSSAASATINWSDGTKENLTLDADGLFTASHSYGSAGQYAIAIQALDLEGSSAATVQAVQFDAPQGGTAQDALVIANTALTAHLGETITLTTSGGSGTGAVYFWSDNLDCIIDGDSLTASFATTCIVYAGKDGSGIYDPATSLPVSFTFSLNAQAPLVITNSVTSASVGTPISLTSNGGSGTGALTYNVTGTGCSISGVNLTASSAATCQVTAHKAESGIYTYVDSPAKAFTFVTPVAQATLTISNTTLTAVAGTVVTLTSTGGSGTGSVTFNTSTLNCSISGNALSVSAAASCVVTATKAASTGFLSATSASKTFVFSLAPQTTLVISTPSTAPTAGTAVVLQTTGGSGTGVLTFTVTGTGCSITAPNLLNATGAVTCSVTAKKAASGIYAAATSAVKAITFTLAPQPTLAISNATLTGTAGTAIALTTTGGAGTGALTYTVTGTGCSISATNLSATGAVTCVVTAKKAASGIYAAATSSPVSFTFSLANQAALVISNSNTAPIAKGTKGITLTTTGGSGTGAVSYKVTGTGCVLATTKLTVATTVTAGTDVLCSVVATKAASGIYGATSSAAKVFTFR